MGVDADADVPAHGCVPAPVAVAAGRTRRTGRNFLRSAVAVAVAVANVDLDMDVDSVDRPEIPGATARRRAASRCQAPKAVAEAGIGEQALLHTSLKPE